MTSVVPPSYISQSDEILDKAYDPRIAKGLLPFLRPYGKEGLLAFALMTLATLTSVAGPYFVKVAIDTGIIPHDRAALYRTILAFFLVSVVQVITNYFRVRIMSRVGQHILFDVRTRMFEHLQMLSLSFYSRYSVGRVITRVINDVGTLREFITWAVMAIARDIFAIVGIIIAMLALDLRLSLLTFSVLPLMALATILFRRAARRNYRRVRAAISWVNSVLAENINGVRVVQAFSRENYNYSIFSGSVNRYHLRTSLDAARLASMFSPVVDLLGAVSTALVVYLGGTAVLGDQITAGVLVAFVLYIDRLFDPIRDLSRRFDTMQSTMAGGERITALLNTPVEIKDRPDAVDLPVIQGRIRFEHVSFSYEDDPAPVLDNIDLEVAPGETVALVGETGAGKTTFIKLLARFHDPSRGRILVDGYDLRDVTQASLRRQMGMVLQDPFLFNGTVEENIRFGRLSASPREVQEAAQAVGAHSFILQLRDGYQTSVQEGGVLLSVGQRQLISFARALLADPRILILDEATSSVDTQTEQIIQRALERLLHGRTSFVIAHRLSTITNAGRIVVIENGSIVESGRHAELIQHRGVYYDLYRTGFQD